MDEPIILFLASILIIALVVKAVYHVKKLSNSKEIDKARNFIDSNVIKAKKYTERKISESYLKGCSWLLINDESTSEIFTFRNKNELLIIREGIVSKAEYEMIIDNNSILITENQRTELYNIVNTENDFLFLNRVASDSILVFANQTKYKDIMMKEIVEKAKKIRSFEYL